MGRSVPLSRLGTLPLAGLPLGVLPSHRDSRFPRSVEEPESGSRRLCAGHRSGSKQVSPELVPGQQLDPGFDGVPTLSTRCRRFTFVRLPDSHLTGFRLPFPDRSRPRLLSPAASGGLGSGPVARSRRTFRHLLYSKTPQVIVRTSPSCRRGARRVAEGNLTPPPSQNRTGISRLIRLLPPSRRFGAELPDGEQTGGASSDGSQPVIRSPFSASKPFQFPTRPLHKQTIQMAQDQDAL